MRDRLVELLYRAHHNASCVMNEGGSEEEILEEEARYLLKYGVIVPPYKCGTVVYVVRSQTSNGNNLYMRRERIDHYRTFKDGTYMIFESGRCSVREGQLKGSVFATLEEAEQALKGDHQ